MGLLAPLYALAALAVVAPIIFHLIRRQPRSQSEFSSLMFLQASPPRLTRRSRLDNLWLLLLRALALCLIAIAFARPFLRSVETAHTQPAGREILLLVDTSGSMQRTDVWQRMVAAANEYLTGLGVADRVGLATFDTHFKMVVPLPPTESTSASTPAAGKATVRSELDRLRPSYRGTKLGEQLMAAVEVLQLRASARGEGDHNEREIVLLSDLHEESGLDALQGFEWPENIRLDVRRITSDQAGNARATVVQNTAGEQSYDQASETIMQIGSDAVTRPAKPDGNVVRVRVENNQSSRESSFELNWLDASAEGGATAGRAAGAGAKHVQVPPGQTRVVPMRYASGSADRIVLSGDGVAHDNIVYVPRTAPRQERVGYIGQIRGKKEDDLFFFLSQVPLSTAVRHVEVQRISSEELPLVISDQQLAALVVEWPVNRASIGLVEEFARSGKPVVVVLSRPMIVESQAVSSTESNAANTSTPKLEGEVDLAKLLGYDQPLSVREADTRDFALLTDIDFRHPLFQPLADAKYNDFGKVRFWTHRVLTLPEVDSDSVSSARVLARFDDHAPALVHRALGRGDLWVVCAGWQTTASQLALSTKFVPLLYGMLDPQRRAQEMDAIYDVGEEIQLMEGSTTSVTHLDGTPVRSVVQDGGLVLEEPGLYWLIENGQRRQIAITLPISESQLDPLDVSRFEQYGIVTGKSDSAEQRLESVRLSQVHELESRQKLWRGILVAAIGFLILETLIAARVQTT